MNDTNDKKEIPLKDADIVHYTKIRSPLLWLVIFMIPIFWYVGVKVKEAFREKPMVSAVEEVSPQGVEEEVQPSPRRGHRR